MSRSLSLLLVLAALAACGPTAEEQRAMDIQKCGGFGFTPNSEGFAGCMMSLSQQRDAQAAADHRAFMARQAQEDQARRDREAVDRARSEAADQSRRDEMARMMNGSAPGIQMPDLSKMNCVSSTAANAGTLSCR